MRQAGIIAAAGIVALEKMTDRLEDDHTNARLLGEGLASIPGIYVALETVQTNMVYFDVEALGLDSLSFAEELEKHNVRASLRPPTGYGHGYHDFSRENFLCDGTLGNCRTLPCVEYTVSLEIVYGDFRNNLRC